MKEGKVTSPSCLVSCIALFLLTLPTPISREAGTAPAPHEHSSQWEGKPQAGREKGAHYFRHDLKKIFKGRVWHREAGFPRDCFIWKKLSLADREDHFRATFSSSSPSMGSGMAGWVNVALTFCRCYFKSKIIHGVKRQALWAPSESVIQGARLCSHTELGGREDWRACLMKSRHHSLGFSTWAKQSQGLGKKGVQNA